MIRKGYSDGPFGQVHWRMLEPKGAASKPDLYCLHPAPFSGLAFTTIMPYLAQDRCIFAPDYPGHGGSDAFKEEPAIEEYAAAMMAVVDEQSSGGAVDLMGFHTGNLVAAEMALTAPEKIGHLALIDVPAFDAETSAKFRAASARTFEITSDLACLEGPWERGMTKRIESQTMERSFEMFTEQLRPGRLMNKAFHAAFSYDVEARLPAVKHETLILASQSALLDATRHAAEIMPGATFIERLDIKRAVLDEAAEKTAAEVLKFLDRRSS
ncbi:alpha/beta fold hydrolase [Parasphingorhabdus cellanae]|uniref:Alpha/beta hydrolase n=1 Tax=Parasphingorhabdus cellanae TaxID=2806553 RepID=A0ABX7T0T2_9SPHN|nr:alpha/beta hydrolase [Parasphingorhabdus cellanae]QTD55163.1 alpha/beta hydrolase [Parasphingorhabdus cellanae]